MRSLEAPAAQFSMANAARLRAIAARIPAWTLPIVLFGGLAIRRWQQIGPYVSGLDAGNWYALGRHAVGDGGKRTDYGYPPLVPLLLQAGRSVVDPMTAAKLVAAGSLLAVLVATFLVARHGMDRLPALAVATTVGLSSTVTEPMAFGGYPQLYAFAAVILAAGFFARFLEDGERRRLVAGAICLSLAALGHHMYFLVGCLVVLLVWVLWLRTGPGRGEATSRSLWLGGAGALAVACFLPTALALRAGGYAPPVNAGGIEAVAALRYGVREAPWFWLPVFVVGTGVVAFGVYQRRGPTWRLAAALAAVSLAIVPLTAEVRLLPPLVVGSSLGVGLALQALSTRMLGTASAWLPRAGAVALPLLLWTAADAQAATYFGYYRVVDRSLLDAVAFVDRYHGDGLVVVRQDRRGWPVGWWFEGLTDVRVVVGSNPKWLGFPAERENAALAERFFARRRSGAEVSALATATGVELLVLRKWDWIGWERWLAEPNPVVAVVFDDDRFMILDVRE